MSSFGGMPMRLEEIGADALVSSANKCLAGVPGFGFVLVRRALLADCKGRARSLSLDLHAQWETMEHEAGKWRYTSPTHAVRAFLQALRELDDEGGVEARHARYAENARRLVEGLAGLGFVPGPSGSVCRVQPGADPHPHAPGSAAPSATPSPEVVFQARGVAKRYAVGETVVEALRSVDLELRRGELVVLLGPSGSGKSTLLNILGGLDAPSAGEVRFLGRDLARSDEEERTRFRRDHVGFVFQFYNLIPSLTASENVALVTEISRDPMSPQEALERVGLGDRLDHFPAQLSGGEQQRVAIARAVAKQPDVLLCDEPTGALDYKTGKLVLEVIQRISLELGTTTAVITHNVPVAKMADRVVTLASGQILTEVYNEERLSPEDIRW